MVPDLEEKIINEVCCAVLCCICVCKQRDGERKKRREVEKNIIWQSKMRNLSVSQALNMRLRK